MAYTRLDHSDCIIHFTRDTEKWDLQKSYQIFYSIIQQGILKATTTKRLGNIPSLCFTEAPYNCLTENCNLNQKYFKRYSPFGFQFTKKYIYRLGGLPVIYSPTDQFEEKNTLTNWRTVSYDPIKKSGNFRDYTWEREWRIKPKNNELKLDPNDVKLIFPTEEWAMKFRNDHDAFHEDPSCNCHCSRDCDIITYDRFHSKEEHESLVGTCPNPDKFPWLLLNMNCKNIESPEVDEV